MDAPTTRNPADRLVLGGHSFIRQLGSDPCPDEAAQLDLVETCLNAGLTWFDTTYQPERVALGRALNLLGRRQEAVLIAWNFFEKFEEGADRVGGPDYYTADRLPAMLDELQCDHIDGLVVHPMSDPAGNALQEQLAVGWKKQGIVRRLGLWQALPPIGADRTGPPPYDFIVHPRNVTDIAAADGVFTQARQHGWETLACSPFVRGWELDKLVARAVARHAMEPQAARERVSDHMLRFSLHSPLVDRLIVSMRKATWVARNIQSAARGPLSAAELDWLQKLLRE